MYTRGTRIFRLLGVRNYLNNYFAYKRLTRSRICGELESHAYLGLGIIEITILTVKVNAPRIRVKLASFAYSGLKIIYIIILPCIKV